MVDVSKFEKLNVADTCSVWNVLASRLLYEAAKCARVMLCMSEFVRYECLHKPGRNRPERLELQGRLRREIERGTITSYSLGIEDLQDVEILQSRRSLSKGELASIALAKKTGQAFMSDDKAAFKLAIRALPTYRVQSTPHLAAWLCFTGLLAGTDKAQIAAQLAEVNRNLEPHLGQAFLEALRCKLMSSAQQNPQGASHADTA